MCTGVRFSDDEGNTYFGRNLDWSFSYGETILVTPRGYHYDTVFGAGGKAKPNAVIGVGVVMADRPMYFDCANEHGLAIAGLNFPGYASFVHEPVEGTPSDHSGGLRHCGLYQSGQHQGSPELLYV